MTFMEFLVELNCPDPWNIVPDFFQGNIVPGFCNTKKIITEKIPDKLEFKCVPDVLLN